MEQLKEIFMNVPVDVQVCLSSTSIPQEMLEITQKFMKGPVKILLKHQELTLDGIKQFYISM